MFGAPLPAYMQEFVLKLCLENRNYVGSLGLKFEEDPFSGYGEICMSLDMHV